MASDIPVRIQFEASAGNVAQVAQGLQKDLGDLAKSKATLPKTIVDIKANPTQLKAELDAVTKAVPPVKLDFEMDIQNILDGVTSLKGKLNDFKLPVIEFAPPPGISLTAKQLEDLRFQAEVMAAVDLKKIRTELNGILNQPGLSNQAAGYAGIVRELDRWKKANGDVMASSQLLQAQYKSMVESAKQGLKEVADRSNNLAQVGQLVTAGFAAVGGILSGAAVSALMVAANFEQLEARLLSVTRNASAAGEKFKFAVELAAKTPFDVRSMVQGAVTLEGFQQKAEEMLPVAANLAAALGKTLPEAALVLGKAASGSTEGFESLRNEYAITTADLVKFGAVSGEIAGTLSHLGKDIDANKNALTKLINVRFGDAIERQSRTLQGALSNLGDAGEQALEGFGKTLIPIATGFARFGTEALGALSKIPAGAKFAIAGFAALGGGLAIVGAGIAGLVTGLLLLQGQLATTAAALLVEFPVAAAAAAGAAGVAGSAITFLGRAALFARGAMSALAAANPILLALGAVALAAGAGFAHMAEESRKAGDATTASANKFAQANSSLRATIDLLNQAGKDSGVQVDIVSKSSAQFGELQNVFAKLTPEQIVKTFSAAGESSTTLKDKLKALELGSGDVQTKLKLLANARQALSTGDLEGFGKAKQALAEYNVEVDAGFGGLERMDETAKGLFLELNRIEQAKSALEGVVNAFVSFADPLEKATKESKALGTFVDLSKQASTATALASALQQVEGQLKSNAAVAGIGTANLEELLAKLGDKTISVEQRAAIVEQIKLVNDAAAIRKTQSDQEKKAIQDKLDAEENAFQLHKAGNETQLHDELRHIQTMLKIAQAGSDEATQLLRQEAATKKQIREADKKHAEELLKKQIDSAKQSVADAKAGIPTQEEAVKLPYPQAQKSQSIVAPDTLQALKDARRDVDLWAEANKKLIDQYPKLAAELEKFRSDNSLDQKREQAKLLKDNLQELGQALALNVSDATTNTGKLAAVEQSINILTAARKGHLVDEQGAQAQINQLTRQKLGLEHQIADEKRQQQDAIRNQEQQTLGQEIQILEARKAGGETGIKIEKELEDAHKKSVQGQLDAVERQKAESIRLGSDEVNAEYAAAQARGQIINAETLRRIAEEQKKTDAVDKNLTAQEQRHKQHVDRLGGINSPLQSFSEAFGGDNFSLGDGFSLSTPTPAKRKPISTRKIQDKVQSDFLKPVTKTAGAEAGPAGGGSTQNNTLNFNGVPFNDVTFERAVVGVLDRLRGDSRLKRK